MYEGQMRKGRVRMTPRPSQPEPFVRGAPYPAIAETPYPRADPVDTARLPADIWHAATVPVGVRLELVGDAEAVDVAYRTATGNLGYRGDAAGITFCVWRNGSRVCEEEAVLGDGLVRLSLGEAPSDQPAVIYLPEGMRPLVQSLTAVRGEIAPAPVLPRWIAYGDSVTQGWIASGPSQGWTAITARKTGLNLVNLGYAQAARGEVVSAEHLAALNADVVSIAYGASCWTRTPHSVGMITEGLEAFLDVVRSGHPEAPVVVMSPIRRPDAERERNRLGATLADIRDAIEAVTRRRIVAGDANLSLVAGEGLIGEDHLADGIHPSDEGHKRIAAAVGKALSTALSSLGVDAPAALSDARFLAGDAPYPTMIRHDGEGSSEPGPDPAVADADAGQEEGGAAPREPEPVQAAS
jgi:lysophospholipase L1-like esterase